MKYILLHKYNKIIKAWHKKETYKIICNAYIIIDLHVFSQKKNCGISTPVIMLYHSIINISELEIKTSKRNSKR